MDLSIYLLTLLSVVFIKGQPERTCKTYAESQLRCEELKPLGNGNICYKSDTEVTNNGKVNSIRTATFYCNTDHHLNGPNVIECLQSFVHKGKEYNNSWNWSPTEPPTCVSGKTRQNSVTKVHTINETEATTLSGTPSANDAMHKADTDLMLLATICGVTVIVVGISALAVLIYSKIKLSRHNYDSSGKTYVRYDSGGQVALPLPLHAATNQTYTGHIDDEEHQRGSDTNSSETSRVLIVDGDDVIPNLHENTDNSTDQGLDSAGLISNAADPEQISWNDHAFHDEYSHTHM